MQPYIAAILVMLIPALSGCVPNAVSYYRPAVEGGRTLSGKCVPIDSTVDLQLGLMPVRAGVSRGHVFLALSGIPGRTIQFSSDEFKFRDLKTNRTLEPRSIEVYRDDGSKNLTVPYPQAGPGKTSRGGMSFWIHVNLPDPIPDNFELIGPAVIVDGVEESFPVIRFEHKLWMGISPFNC